MNHFTTGPQVLVGSEPRNNAEKTNDLLSTGSFSIRGGDDPRMLSNYVFEKMYTLKHIHNCHPNLWHTNYH